MSEWAGWFELLIVLAFAVGYGAVELVCKRLDRQREREREAAAQQPDTGHESP